MIYAILYINLFTVGWRFMRGITWSEYVENSPRLKKFLKFLPSTERIPNPKSNDVNDTIPKHLFWRVVDVATSKYLFAVYAGAATFFIPNDWLDVYLTILSLVWAVADGWGRGFLAVHGWKRVFDAVKGYKWWVDKPAEWIFRIIKKRNPETKSDRRMYGFIWMSIQCMYKFAPIVAVKVWSLSNMVLLLSLPVLAASFGASYWLMGLKHTPRSIMWAELLSGFILANYLVWL